MWFLESPWRIFLREGVFLGATPLMVVLKKHLMPGSELPPMTVADGRTSGILK